MSKLPSQSQVRETAGYVGNLVTQARLAWRLLVDRQVPGWVKLIPIAGIAYLISPVDLIPDWLVPGLGELDDLAILLLSAKLFVNLSPPAVVRQHLEELTGRRRRQKAGEEPASEQCIEVPYRVVGSEEDQGREG